MRVALLSCFAASVCKTTFENRVQAYRETSSMTCVCLANSFFGSLHIDGNGGAVYVNSASCWIEIVSTTFFYCYTDPISFQSGESAYLVSASRFMIPMSPMGAPDTWTATALPSIGAARGSAAGGTASSSIRTAAHHRTLSILHHFLNVVPFHGLLTRAWAAFSLLIPVRIHFRR
jgi:hypothetical protein